ncbi:MAG: hypothetical protein KC468_06190 [Myxococcales bacterium]|nr:hypothetical protein [Myxococcales bacterium]
MELERALAVFVGFSAFTFADAVFFAAFFADFFAAFVPVFFAVFFAAFFAVFFAAFVPDVLDAFADAGCLDAFFPDCFDAFFVFDALFVLARVVCLLATVFFVRFVGFVFVRFFAIFSPFPAQPHRGRRPVTPSARYFDLDLLSGTSSPSSARTSSSG